MQNSLHAGSGRYFQNWTQRDWLAALLLVVGVILTYQPVWHAGFLWDDDNHVTANACIIGPRGLVDIWTTHEARFFPLTLTTYWLIHAFWGVEPLAYHLTNVFLHAASALVLWAVLERLRVPGAWFGAALWALHPVMVESVAWVAEMKNTQSALFYLLTILFFIKTLQKDQAGGKWSYAFSLLFAFLAMASKSSTVVLPFVLCLCAWWMEGSWSWRILVKVLPFFLITATVSILTVYAVNVENLYDYDPQPLVRSWPEKIATAGDVIWFYLGKLVWPYPLMSVYPRWEINPSQFAAYFPVAAATCAFILLWWNRHGWGRPWFFAFAYFIAALLPVLGLVSHNFMRFSFVADHMQYLAAMGSLALAGAAITRLAEVISPNDRLRHVVYAGSLIILGVASWQHARVYETEETLWSDDVAKNPGSWVGYNNLGLVYLDQKRPDEAIANFRQTVALYPRYATGYLNIGNGYLNKKQYDEALGNYLQAAELNPFYDRAYTNMGHVFLEQGKVDEALVELQKALEIGPGNTGSRNEFGRALIQKGELDQARGQFGLVLAIEPDNNLAHYGLAYILFKKGQMDESIAEYRKALKTNPHDANSYRGLGDALAAKGQLNAAAAAYQKAVENDPDDASAQFGLGLSLARMGRADEAIVEVQKALKLDAHNADVYNNLGNVLQQKGRNDEAALQYQKSLEIDPRNAMTYNNLGAVYFRKGQWDEAIAQFEKVIEIDPKSDLPHYCLGLAYAKKGETAKAITEYQKALAINPNNDLARKNLAAAQAQKPAKP